MIHKAKNAITELWKFYIDGFENMERWGRQVWLVIIIKLVIMFAILKIFFFPDFLKTNFETNEERSQYVLEVLTEPK